MCKALALAKSSIWLRGARLSAPPPPASPPAAFPRRLSPEAKLETSAQPGTEQSHEGNLHPRALLRKKSSAQRAEHCGRNAEKQRTDLGTYSTSEGCGEAGCAASEAACICSRALYWVPAPVRSCVYCTTGPLLRTAPWGRNKRAQHQHRVLTTARDCPISHETRMRSPRQAEQKHWPLTAGHWQSFESQPSNPGRFCLSLPHPAGKTRCKSCISGSSAKNSTTEHAANDPRIPR